MREKIRCLALLSMKYDALSHVGSNRNPTALLSESPVVHIFHFHFCENPSGGQKVEFSASPVALPSTGSPHHLALIARHAPLPGLEGLVPRSQGQALPRWDSCSTQHLVGQQKCPVGCGFHTRSVSVLRTFQEAMSPAVGSTRCHLFAELGERAFARQCWVSQQTHGTGPGMGWAPCGVCALLSMLLAQKGNPALGEMFLKREEKATAPQTW